MVICPSFSARVILLNKLLSLIHICYMSVVEKVQYNCAKHLQRPLLVIYYSKNNIQGGEQTEEADPKEAPWNAIVPGARDEYNFSWACAQKPAK